MEETGQYLPTGDAECAEVPCWCVEESNMPKYKVENEATARALAKQWYDAYRVHCDIWNREQYWEVGRSIRSLSTRSGGS
jgi:hypothetical protein